MLIIVKLKSSKKATNYIYYKLNYLKSICFPFKLFNKTISSLSLLNYSSSILVIILSPFSIYSKSTYNLIIFIKN